MDMLKQGSTFSMLSGGITSMGNKIATLGMDKKPAATAPTPGGGSYTGPAAMSAGGASASMNTAAHAGMSATAFDRYGRPFAESGGGASGDVDLNTINQIIANLEGTSAPAPAPAQSALPPSAQAQAPSGLGLGGVAVSRTTVAHMDDDARLAAAIAASLGATSASQAAPSTLGAVPTMSGLGLSPQTVQTSAPAPAPIQPPVRSVAGQFEETLVSALTTPSGMRVAPAKHDLAQLCAQAKTLDLSLLLMLFCSKFEDSAITWQVEVCSCVCVFVCVCKQIVDVSSSISVTPISISKHDHTMKKWTGPATNSLLSGSTDQKCR